KGGCLDKKLLLVPTALALLVFITAGGQPAYSAAPFYEGKAFELSLGQRGEAGTIRMLVLSPAISANIFQEIRPSSSTTCRAPGACCPPTISSKSPNPTG